MRRSEREVTDEKRINEIIDKADIIRLGLNDDGEVYIVPMNFGYKYDGKYTFYFHSAIEGRKIDIIKMNPKASFELDVDYALKVGESACAHTAYFSSVMGVGEIEFIVDSEEKKFAIDELMYHHTKTRNHKFDEKAFSHIKVFKLKVEKLSCKQYQKNM